MCPRGTLAYMLAFLLCPYLDLVLGVCEPPEINWEDFSLFCSLKESERFVHYLAIPALTIEYKFSGLNQCKLIPLKF